MNTNYLLELHKTQHNIRKNIVSLLKIFEILCLDLEWIFKAKNLVLYCFDFINNFYLILKDCLK